MKIAPMTISMTPASWNIWRYSFRRILENSLNLERNRFVFMIIVFPVFFFRTDFSQAQDHRPRQQQKSGQTDQIDCRIGCRRSAHALIDEQVHIVGHGKKVSDDPYRQIHGQKGKRQARERERKHQYPPPIDSPRRRLLSRITMNAPMPCRPVRKTARSRAAWKRCR